VASVPQPIPATATAGRPRRGVPGGVTALLFLAPALILLLIFLVYPMLSTIRMSFDRGLGGNFSRWVGLDNYVALFQSPSFITAIVNNILWLIFYTSFVIFFGLIIAVVAMRVRYESLIKAIVFLPMAIAATALGVIWTFVYQLDPNTGLLNALLGVVGLGPVSWLGDPAWVNAALIAVGIWGSAGFATVILSAALKGISPEILEAARTDGANEFQIFWRIILPMVSLPISVLAVTLVVNVVKLFDIPYVMTQGGPGNASRVIALEFYKQDFSAGQFGKAAAVAVVMLIILIPVMMFNIRRFRSGSVV
jgi:alpha-glucoside transport system permease protein